MFIMNVKFDMGLVKSIGRGSMKYGKKIVVEGIKSMAAQGAMKIVNTAFDEGLGSVKSMTFDEIIGIDDKKKSKLFSKKKKDETKETYEDGDILDAEFEEVIVDEAEVDIDDSVINMNTKRAN
jgi:hypothetical protein